MSSNRPETDDDVEMLLGKGPDPDTFDEELRASIRKECRDEVFRKEMQDVAKQMSAIMTPSEFRRLFITITRKMAETIVTILAKRSQRVAKNRDIIKKLAMDTLQSELGDLFQFAQD